MKSLFVVSGHPLHFNLPLQQGPRSKVKDSKFFYFSPRTEGPFSAFERFLAGKYKSRKYLTKEQQLRHLKEQLPRFDFSQCMKLPFSIYVADFDVLPTGYSSWSEFRNFLEVEYPKACVLESPSGKAKVLFFTQEKYCDGLDPLRWLVSCQLFPYLDCHGTKFLFFTRAMVPKLRSWFSSLRLERYSPSLPLIPSPAPTAVGLEDSVDTQVFVDTPEEYEAKEPIFQSFTSDFPVPDEEPLPNSKAIRLLPTPEAGMEKLEAYLKEHSKTRGVKELEARRYVLQWILSMPSRALASLDISQNCIIRTVAEQCGGLRLEQCRVSRAIKSLVEAGLLEFIPSGGWAEPTQRFLGSQDAPVYGRAKSYRAKGLLAELAQDMAALKGNGAPQPAEPEDGTWHAACLRAAGQFYAYYGAEACVRAYEAWFDGLAGCNAKAGRYSFKTICSWLVKKVA